MNGKLYHKLTTILKDEAEDTLKNEKDNDVKISKMNDIFNLKKILDNYDDLEPTLKKYFMEKVRKEKYEREK